MADQSPGVWGACALRRRRAGTVATAPPPLAAARALLARQRHVLRRLQLDLGAFEPDSSMPGDEALAAAIAAACGPGSGLTDLTLGLAGALPPCVAQVCFDGVGGRQCTLFWASPVSGLRLRAHVPFFGWQASGVSPQTGAPSLRAAGIRRGSVAVAWSLASLPMLQSCIMH